MKNKRILSIAAAALTASLLFSACKKNDDPKPDEQELITTAKITFTGNGGSQTFTYKVQNGFNATSAGTVQIDTIKLAPNTTYTTSVQILNESASPVENTTDEIVKEQAEHLFLYLSTPSSGAGALSFSDGNKDSNGKPFNLTGTIKTGDAGSGKLDLYLMHQPTNKEGLTPDASGGETDVHAIYPVQLR